MEGLFKEYRLFEEDRSSMWEILLDIIAIKESDSESIIKEKCRFSTNDEGNTILQISCLALYSNGIKFALDIDVDVNALNNQKENCLDCLSWAILSKTYGTKLFATIEYMEMIKCLLDAGVHHENRESFKVLLNSISQNQKVELLDYIDQIKLR